MIRLRNPFGADNNNPLHIIVHSMGEYIFDGGRYYHATDFLYNNGLSAHILVRPDGKLIRLRQDNEGAYHAKGYNTDTLGIEFLVPGAHDYFSFKKAITSDYVTENAYSAGLKQIKAWIDMYGISRIDRHSDVDPDRKVDPGSGFPWNKLLEDLE